jgi:SAM-dependent methyltransferase
MTGLRQHLDEMRRNAVAWEKKPLLRLLYAQFYRRITALIRRDAPGRVVELGSGIGNLRTALPEALCTDIFPNPWLDLVCDGYELPFQDGTLSHLVLFDVFHHLQFPAAFLHEARRTLAPGGRVIIFEPFISLAGRAAYGLFHHEPLGLSLPIDFSDRPPPGSRSYYAAQGNATRLFFRDSSAGTFPGGTVFLPHPVHPVHPVHSSLFPGWTVFHREAFSAFGYLLSGGFSKPALYPQNMLGFWTALDRSLSRWPRLFGARCLIALEKSGLQPSA